MKKLLLSFIIINALIVSGVPAYAGWELPEDTPAEEVSEADDPLAMPSDGFEGTDASLEETETAEDEPAPEPSETLEESISDEEAQLLAEPETVTEPGDSGDEGPIPPSDELPETDPEKTEPEDEEPGRQPELFEPVPVSGLPVLNIHLNGFNLETIKAGSKEEKYDGNIADLYIDGSRTVFEKVTIKGRGNSTWGYPKKPYQIKFDKKTDLFGQGKAKKWILLADYTDTSHLRTAAGMKLALDIGIEYSLPMGQFVELYFDNEYEGLYYLTRKVEVGSTSVPLSDEEGIIAEIDNLHEPDESWRLSEKGTVVMIKEAVEDDDESLREAALDAFMVKYNRLETAACEGDWETVQQICDVGSFVKYFVFEDFIANPDAFGSSFYIYTDGPDDLLHAGPVWDLDRSFANKYALKGDTVNPCRTWAFTDPRETGNKEGKRWAPLFSDLMTIPAFYDLAASFYQSDFKAAAQDLVNYFLIESAGIYDAAARDNAVWRSGAKGLTEASRCAAWITDRLAYFDFLYGDRLEEEGTYMVTGGSFHCPLEYKQQEDGFYSLTGPGGLCLDVEKASPLAGAKVQLHKSNGTDAQKWFFTPDGHIVAKATGLCLSANGSQLSVESWGGNDQVFKLQRIDKEQNLVEAGTYYTAASQLKSGIFMSVKSGSLDKKGNVLIRTGNTLQMRWLFEAQGDGSYVIRNARSRLVMETAGGSLEKKANIRQNSFSDKDYQKWYLYQKDDGYFEIINKQSLLNLDVAGGSTAKDTNIQQYKQNSTKSQGWKLKKAGYDCQISGEVYIKTSMGEATRAIEVAGASKKKKANIDIRTLTSSKSAVWRLEKKSSGCYTIKNVNSGLVLDVQGGKIADRTNVQQYTSNGTSAQNWILIGNEDGTVTIFGQGSGLVLDVAGGNNKNGTNVQIYKTNNTTAQKWKIESAAG